MYKSLDNTINSGNPSHRNKSPRANDARVQVFMKALLMTSPPPTQKGKVKPKIKVCPSEEKQLNTSHCTHILKYSPASESKLKCHSWPGVMPTGRFESKRNNSGKCAWDEPIFSKAKWEEIHVCTCTWYARERVNMWSRKSRKTVRGHSPR